jgi:hypothetical protein
MPKRRVLAFGEYGGVASAICNNLIADLLFLRKCHAPAQSLLRLGPRSWVFAPASGLPQVQARERGRVPCSHRIWSLAAHCMAFRGAGDTQEGSGCALGGGSNIRRDRKKYLREIPQLS